METIFGNDFMVATTNPVFAFSKEDKVKELSLSQLQTTLSETKKPSSRPIDSWEFITWLMCTIEKYVPASNINMNPIWISKCPDNTAIISPNEKSIYNESNTPLNKWLFQRMVGKIEIKTPYDKEMSTNIAFSYNKQGIQVTFGQNVWICQNMCIFGSNNIKTYGNNKVPFEKMQELITKWMMSHDEMRMRDLEIISHMKSFYFADTQTAIDSLIGKLYRASIDQAYYNGTAPLDTNKLSGFTQKIQKPGAIVSDGELSLWELYNMGTEVLKPQNTDHTVLLDTVANFSNFMVKEYLPGILN